MDIEVGNLKWIFSSVDMYKFKISSHDHTIVFTIALDMDILFIKHVFKLGR